ncbi:DUF4832 domain-containing protein [Gordoniibacillus kamchatkensis]|uniref:DUF4832 domain-containing protein n=1 Tax=Gordoniibacillus kamchatkensis TaxID=1590651 RepID=UPI000697E979|nr:DUF4832 domain-containing protein [Paenibacillus sp. VKM B-2647]
MKKRRMGPLLCAAALSAFVWSGGGKGSGNEAHAAVGPITVNLTESSEAFKNPIMGFRPSRYINDSSFADREYSDIYKQYIKYTDLETDATDSVQKIIDWSNTAWAGIENKNIKVVPRVVIVYPGTGEYWPNGVPHDDPVNEWLSDTLKSRLVAFIGKLGQAWDNDPRVAFVELGLYGNWGENHIYPLKFPDGTDRIPLSFQTALGDAYTAAFHNKKVLVRYPETFTAYNFGIQWDSFALPDDAAGGNGEISRDTWRTQINSGEVAYDWGDQSNLGGSPDGTLGDTSHTNYVIDWIMNTHTSSLGWISDYTSSNSSVEAGATAMQKVLGYRFVLNQATFSGNVTPGGTMNVSFQVVNKGSSPFYYNWPVEASLLKSDGTVAWKGLFQADIRNWLPGTGWNSSTRSYNQAPTTNTVNGAFTIPSSLPNGTYTLALSILDPAGWKPSVRFANTNYYTGGRTPIGKVGIGMDPADQNLGAFAGLKSDNTLGYSLQSGAYDGGTGGGGTAVSYEAEASGNTLAGGASTAACSACSGGSKVGYVGNNNGTLQFNGVNVQTAGAYTLAISYLNGDAARSAQLSVNGGSAISLNFPSTGGWDKVGTLQTSVQLSAGNNTITFSNASGWAPDFDRIQLDTGGGSGGDTQAPTVPANVAVTATTASSITLGWSASTDNVGVSGYDVYRDGTYVGTTAATTYTDNGLSSGTSYSYTVKAKDAAGNVSAASNATTGTTNTAGGGTALLLDNFDNSPAWPGTNDLGKWTGANGFVNDAGVIENGALKLQYNNAGWFGSDVTQSIAGYTKLIVRIKGAAGGEESQFHLILGGVEKTLGALSGDTVTTSYKDIAIDLAANGINQASPGQLQMSFWYGSAGTVWIDEIRFE